MTKIDSVIFCEREEEGGWMTISFYPSGYARAEGESGSGGYQTPLENGWYKVNDFEKLQELFDAAKGAVKKYPNGTKPKKMEVPMSLNVNYASISLGDKKIDLYGDELIVDFSAMDLLSKQKNSGNRLSEPVRNKPVASLSSKDNFSSKKAVVKL